MYILRRPGGKMSQIDWVSSNKGTHEWRIENDKVPANISFILLDKFPGSYNQMVLGRTVVEIEKHTFLSHSLACPILYGTCSRFALGLDHFESLFIPVFLRENERLGGNVEDRSGR
jgi:hypothetical protein